MRTFTMTVTRERVIPHLVQIADLDGELPPCEEEIEVEIEYSMYGSYVPASWEQPAEYPEVELGSVSVYDDKGNRSEFELTDSEVKEAIEKAYRDADERRRDYDSYDY